eukprot:CAMPEP_0184673794 /NCGR_PEP_ID=MMETSP0308-20130426/86879_1 /TAXON_ID=38269 /ORGANISM="Gloeochaete witrockiana, Strain SAG 46.84" /LENGTH=100 /DNA_ID=CAMNT_0027121321 /DNA_START=1011 /DNA_END=1313 /DNA_ORIENTATION=+
MELKVRSFDGVTSWSCDGDCLKVFDDVVVAEGGEAVVFVVVDVATVSETLFREALEEEEGEEEDRLIDDELLGEGAVQNTVGRTEETDEVGLFTVLGLEK